MTACSRLQPLQQHRLWGCRRSCTAAVHHLSLKVLLWQGNICEALLEHCLHQDCLQAIPHGSTATWKFPPLVCSADSLPTIPSGSSLRHWTRAMLPSLPDRSGQPCWPLLAETACPLSRGRALAPAWQHEVLSFVGSSIGNSFKGHAPWPHLIAPGSHV